MSLTDLYPESLKLVLFKLKPIFLEWLNIKYIEKNAFEIDFIQKSLNEMKQMSFLFYVYVNQRIMTDRLRL